MCYVPLLCALSNVPICCLVEMAGRSCHHQYFKKTLVIGENLADVFHEEQQPVLLLLQIVFQEEHSCNKFRNDKLETCEHSPHIT